MKKSIIIISALTLLTLASCVKEEQFSSAPLSKKTARISAVAEQPTVSGEETTKTALGEEDVVLWSAGDKIALFDANGGTKSEYSLIYGENTKSGEFEGPEINAANFVGVYPSSYVDADASMQIGGGLHMVPVTIPATQKYVANSFPEGANLSAAYGSNNLEFKNVMGVLELQLYAQSTRSIKQIQLAAAENLAGKAQLTVPEDGSDPQLNFVSDTTKVITLQFDQAIRISTDSEAPTKVYIVVPVGALKNGFTISMMNANTDPIYALRRSTKDNTIIRSKILEMPNLAVAPTITRSTLSNTLVIPTSGTAYMYPLEPETGNLMGHFKTYVNTALFSAVSGSSVANSSSVKVYVNASISFTAPGNEGSICYAIKDYYGQILWSWTIWVTDTPQDITLIDGTVIMDRNLGATATDPSNVTASYTECRGLRYQWGRKDPVYKASSDAAYVVLTSEETGTVDYAIKNPAKFIAPTEGSQYLGDWLWTGDDTLWGATKTKYDPCPAGYKVPSGNSPNGFWYACDFESHQVGDYDSTNSGYYFNVVKDSDEPIWIPTAGYYNYNVGTGLAGNYAGGRYLNYDSVPVTSGAHNQRVFWLSSTGVANLSNASRSLAGSIRCVKIQ